MECRASAGRKLCTPFSPESRKVHEKVEPILTVCTADEKKVLPKQKTVQRMPIWNELFIDKK